MSADGAVLTAVFLAGASAAACLLLLVVALFRVARAEHRRRVGRVRRAEAARLRLEESQRLEQAGRDAAAARARRLLVDRARAAERRESLTAAGFQLWEQQTVGGEPA